MSWFLDTYIFFLLWALFFRGKQFLPSCFLLGTLNSPFCSQQFGTQLHHIELVYQKGWKYGSPEVELSWAALASVWLWMDPEVTEHLARRLDRGGKCVTAEQPCRVAQKDALSWMWVGVQADDRNPGEVRFNREHHQEPCPSQEDNHE